MPTAESRGTVRLEAGAKSPSGDSRVDDAIVFALRDLAERGASIVELCEVIRTRMGASSWITDSFYLRAAFSLSVDEIAELLAWRRYGGRLSDDAIGPVVTRMIDEHRREWERREG